MEPLGTLIASARFQANVLAIQTILLLNALARSLNIVLLKNSLSVLAKQESIVFATLT